MKTTLHVFGASKHSSQSTEPSSKKKKDLFVFVFCVCLCNLVQQEPVSMRRILEIRKQTDFGNSCSPLLAHDELSLIEVHVNVRDYQEPWPVNSVPAPRRSLLPNSRPSPLNALVIELDPLKFRATRVVFVGSCKVCTAQLQIWSGCRFHCMVEAKQQPKLLNVSPSPSWK